jgi:hypothetical protein
MIRLSEFSDSDELDRIRYEQHARESDLFDVVDSDRLDSARKSVDPMRFWSRHLGTGLRSVSRPTPAP